MARETVWGGSSQYPGFSGPGEHGRSHELAQSMLCGRGDWPPLASVSCPVPSLALTDHEVGYSHRALLGRWA